MVVTAHKTAHKLIILTREFINLREMIGGFFFSDVGEKCNIGPFSDTHTHTHTHTTRHDTKYVQTHSHTPHTHTHTHTLTHTHTHTHSHTHTHTRGEEVGMSRKTVYSANRGLWNRLGAPNHNNIHTYVHLSLQETK